MRQILEHGIRWVPLQAMLSMFVAMPRHLAAPQLKMANPTFVPDRVSLFALEDAFDIVPSHHLFTYTAIRSSERIPRDLDAYLERCLKEALTGGAIVAWFAFEGSFHFDHLLTVDIASSVYAVADATGVALALEDDFRESREWRTRLNAARVALGL